MAGGESISVREVRSLALAIFDKLSEAGVETIRVDQNFYWSVFPTEAFSVEEPELVLSDVADDLLDLRAEATTEVSSFWHALHHLSGVCSAMAAATLDAPKAGRETP